MFLLTHRFLRIIAGSLVLLAISVQASTVVEQPRAAASVPDTVEIYGPINLELSQGDVFRLAVVAEARLQPKIVTRFSGRVLRVEIEGEIRGEHDPINVQLELPTLVRLVTRGRGVAHVMGFHGKRIDIVRIGSGSLQFRGQFAEVKLSSQGSGSLDVNGGKSESMEVNVNGSGYVEVSGAVNVLSGRLRGSGQLSAKEFMVNSVRLNVHGWRLDGVRTEDNLRPGV